MHHCKDGSLDMRHESSRKAIASGDWESKNKLVCNNWGLSPSTQTNDKPKKTTKKSSKKSKRANAILSVIERQTFDTPRVHRCKDGSLDMRYKSSKQVVASDAWTDKHSQVSISSSQKHYCKDGSLDMRYKSSKQATTPGFSDSKYTQPSQTDFVPNFCQDGSLDMRYQSNKLLVAMIAWEHSGTQADFLVDEIGFEFYDDMLDMRDESSRQTIASNYWNNCGTQSSIVIKQDADSRRVATVSSKKSVGDEILHFRKDGSLDMRYKACRDAIATGAYVNDYRH